MHYSKKIKQEKGLLFGRTRKKVILTKISPLIGISVYNIVNYYGDVGRYFMQKKVLVVEDDANIAELLRLYLERDGLKFQSLLTAGKASLLLRDQILILYCLI